MWYRIEELLNSLKLFWNARDEVDGYGTNLGVVVSRGQAAIHSETFVSQKALSEIFALLKTLQVIPMDFAFVSFQALHNARVFPHKDRNSDLSLLVSTGSFSGES